MENYLSLVLRKPILFLCGIVIITIVLGTGLGKLQFDGSIDSIMPKRDSEYILNEEVKKTYGNNGKFIISCVTTDDAMKPQFLKDFGELLYDVEEFHVYDEDRENSRLEIFDGIKTKSTVPFSEILSKYDEDPAFQRLLSRKKMKLFGPKKQLDTSDLQKLRNKIQSANALKEKESIDLVVSPFTVQDLVGKDDALITRDLIEKDDNGRRIIPETAEEIDTFKKRITNNPAFEKGIFVRNKKTGKISDFGIMMRLIDTPSYEDIVLEIYEIADSHKNLNITLQGIPVVQHEIVENLKTDLSRFLPLVLLVVLIVFFFNFRTFRGVLLPFLTLVFADIWILGLMGHLGFKISIVGISLPPLMIAVGSSYSIHILNQYYIDAEKIALSDKLEGIKDSMLHISLTVALAGVTTFIGFIMLVTNQVSSIREWGIFSALGVLFAVFLSITLIPAVFSLMSHKKKNKDIAPSFFNRFNPVDRIVSVISNLVINHYKAVLSVCMVVVIISIVGITKIIVETSVLAYFKDDDKIRTSSTFIGERFGGSFGLNILIDSGKDNGIKNPEFLSFIETFRVWLEAEENSDLCIGRTDAFTDFIKTMHMAMYDNDNTYYKIPAQKVDIESYINTFAGDDDNDDGRIDQFEPYVDRHYRTVNILARIWGKNGKNVSSTEMEHIILRINEYLDSNLPRGAQYKTSGEPKIIVQLAKHVVNGQIMSLLFSLLAVGFISMLLFKDWRAGIISLIPIVVAVIFNFGVMGWFGFRLDLATAIIASITIGIGIDDTIHFMNTYRHFRARGNSIDETMGRTIEHSGKAIIYTSLALILGFMVLFISNFKPVMFFGLLVAVTMVATTIGALLILPATIKLTGVKLDESESKSGIWKYLDIGKIFKFDEYN